MTTVDEQREQWERTHAAHEDLKQARSDYLKENRNAEWRRLVKRGELEAELEFKAKECRELAESLIAQGWFYREAWYHAKAAEILNQPTID